MAYPGARLLRLSKDGLEPVTIEETDHYRIMPEFCADQAGFVEGVMAAWTPRRREIDRF
jgi:predicted ATPase